MRGQENIQKSIAWGYFIPTKEQLAEEKRLAEAPMDWVFTQYNIKIECCPQMKTLPTESPSQGKKVQTR